MSGRIRDSLRRRIDGSVSRPESVRVRYTGFKEGRLESESRYRGSKRRKKGLMGPSGSFYEFRQHGGSSKSQWVEVHAPEDVEAFEEAEEFEVERE